jgi:hypothetical protein
VLSLELYLIHRTAGVNEANSGEYRVSRFLIGLGFGYILLYSCGD